MPHADARMNPGELPMVPADPAATLSCSLDLDGLVAQRERYARIGENVVDVRRSPRSLTIELSPAVDAALVEETLRIERECCPFFDLGFDPKALTLTVAVDSDDHAPALEAIAFALGSHSEASSRPVADHSDASAE